MNFRQLAKKIALLLLTKKAEEIVILDIRKLTFLTDYFLLANASSILHLRTLRETLNENLNKENIFSLREEGSLSSPWQVLDYGGLIVHLFLPEIRNFYNLEKFWQGAKKVSWQTRVTAMLHRQVAEEATDKKRRLPRIKKSVSSGR